MFFHTKEHLGPLRSSATAGATNTVLTTASTTPPAITVSLGRKSYCITAVTNHDMARKITRHARTMTSKHLFPKLLMLHLRNAFPPKQAVAGGKKAAVHGVPPLATPFHRHPCTEGKLVHAATAALQRQLFKQHFLDHAGRGLPHNISAGKSVSLLSSLARSPFRNQPQLRF